MGDEIPSPQAIAKDLMQQHFVNLYRKVWWTNKGLLSKEIDKMSIAKLEKGIENLKKFDDMPQKPQPGDIIRVTSTDDSLIPVGAVGVIEGSVGRIRPAYAVLFNPSPMPWWDKKNISSSGGPQLNVPAIVLKATGEQIDQPFQYFPHLPDKDAALIQVHRVALWEIDLHSLSDDLNWIGIAIENIPHYLGDPDV